MNFRQIVEAAREACAKKMAGTSLFDWAIRDFRKRMNRIFKSGWEDIDLSDHKIINAADAIAYFHIRFYEALQFIGMSMSSGDEAYDKMLWDELTEVLAAFREVLVRNFNVELPEARVVSMVTEMVEEGFLEECCNEAGVLCVRPKEPLYDLKIKIIKTPAGPAPREIKKKWMEVRMLPARKFQPGQSQNSEYKEGGYKVPKLVAYEALREVSPEGADWFVENFGEFPLELLFHLDEAEIVL